MELGEGGSEVQERCGISRLKPRRRANIWLTLPKVYNRTTKVGGNRGLGVDTYPSINVFSELLESYAQKYPIYAIFDAMDECAKEYRDNVFTLFPELQKYSY